jgi:hypothetical protein
MATLLTANFQTNDSSGNPRSGAKLYFYLAGTATPLTVYQDAAAATPHANPVVADASGDFAAIYVPGTTSFKYALYTSADVLVKTVDDITPPILLDTADQSVTGGARIVSLDLGTKSSGTVTPDPGDRPVQRYINGGAHTLAPGSNYGSYRLDITNNASAGTITTSGWSKVTGGFTTTNGNKFMCFCNISEAGSLLSIQNLF